MLHKERKDTPPGYDQAMDFLATPDAGLFGLFLVSFLAATLLPGGSEAALLAFVAHHPDSTLAALGWATLGNTLGSLSTYVLARSLPARYGEQLEGRHHKRVQRWGAPILFFAWLPLIGDVLCAAAGLLRLPWLPVMLWIAAGKGLRYLALVAGWQLLAQ